MNQQEVEKIQQELKDLSALEVLNYVFETYNDKVTFATSLGAEDQVLAHMISGINPEAKIFTLDTGRLFPETYDLIDRTESKLNVKIQIFFPDATEVENMVNKHGINLFYDSIDNRKLCCKVRKINPLQWAFSGLDAWVCGLRKDQAVTRESLSVVEWDVNNKLAKYNPLYNWTEKMVWEYIEKHNIPYNTLHDKGFPSIGCQPCTRAVEEGEDIRAGRWWWENPENKECGLHKQD